MVEEGFFKPRTVLVDPDRLDRRRCPSSCTSEASDRQLGTNSKEGFNRKSGEAPGDVLPYLLKLGTKICI
jgi:hypothetical protein